MSIFIVVREETTKLSFLLLCIYKIDNRKDDVVKGYAKHDMRPIDPDMSFIEGC